MRAEHEPQTDGRVRDGVVSCAWRTSTVGHADAPVTLVALRVRNDATVAQRVRIRNRLDGPLASPRRRGVREPGWTERGFAGDVAAEATLALGYACITASESRPPVSLAALGPADAFDDERATPASVVRTLGDSRPPAAVSDASGAATDSTDSTALAESRIAAETVVKPRETADDSAGLPVTPSGSLPPPVGAWLNGLEARLDAAERLDGASVAAATATLSVHDGIDGLAATLDSDAAALRAIAARVEELRSRVEATDPPLDALRRLA